MRKTLRHYTKVYVQQRLCAAEVIFILLAFLSVFCNPRVVAGGPLDRNGTQWAPVIEWTFENPTYQGNPYDLIAEATFVHLNSGMSHKTEIFYAGGNTWKLRFTGTRTGEWNFTTSSGDADLDGLSGKVSIEPNPDTTVKGFVTNFGNKWGRSATGEVFIPQFLMYKDPRMFHNQPDVIDADIQTFFREHGFNGFHLYSIAAGWFDIDKTGNGYDEIGSDAPTPDQRTFEALELLISKVHAEGGVVHIWMWGDQSRRQTPKKWGANGEVDKRLQRYIAARLGPLPGWTVGYGFDLDEWASKSQIKQWHDYIHSKMGWNHYLGGRPEGPNDGTDHSEYVSWNTGLDYSSYEHHRPTYEVYVAALENIQSQPVFSEDRFRIRDEGRSKDYSMEDTRRGLWDSAMAGGVANIWGNLMSSTSLSGTPSGGEASGPYPKPEWIKTWAMFFDHRFLKAMVRDNRITNGVCLRHPGHNQFVFYNENSVSIEMDLSTMTIAQRAVAVDTRLPYREIDLGEFTASKHTWIAPYTSDWAIAVGDFSQDADPDASEDAPAAPANLRLVQ